MPVSELQWKLDQVRRFLRREKAAGLLLGRQSNFAWLTCGGEGHVPLNSELACARLLVTPRRFELIASRIEMPRLAGEVLRHLADKPVLRLHEWHDPAAAQAQASRLGVPARWISDTGEWGSRADPAGVAALRHALHPAEVRRYRKLGRLAEAALRECCLAVQPGMSEMEIAGMMAAACRQRHLTATVLLVAAEDRIRKYRHPLPTRRKVRRHVMLVLSARQGGLIVALTRIVHFGKPSRDLLRRHRAVCQVDAALHGATRPGVPVKDVFREGMDEYARQGFPDEWTLHHQGGPTGYDGRVYLGSPTCSGRVLLDQPFAWNPSIAGTKSEDTLLARANGPEVMTAARDWPMVSVETASGMMERPDILVR